MSQINMIFIYNLFSYSKQTLTHTAFQRMISHPVFSRPLKLNNNQILYAPLNRYRSDFESFLVVINLKKEEVNQIVPYPIGFDLLDCNLAYDREYQNVYLLQHEDDGPQNLYKINLSDTKWTLIYEGLGENTEIVSTPNSDSCALFIRNHHCFLIAPTETEDLHPFYTFNVYEFDESQRNKIKFIKPTKENYYSLDEIYNTLIIPKSNDNKERECLIMNKPPFRNFVKQISLNDGTIKETLNEQKAPNDRKNGYVFQFDARNGAQAIRGGKIIIFNLVTIDQDHFIDILDIKSPMNITQSCIHRVCRGRYDVVLIENVEREKKLTHQWIRNQILEHMLWPVYLSDIVTSYYCNDKIIIISKQPTLLSVFLWTQIAIDDILDQDQQTAKSKKYTWTYSMNKW